jgi:transcriptional regulator with XRE-family HTH domain
MSQPRISEIETPGARSLTLETLLKIATAFDVGLNVRFVPFSTLVDWVESVGTQPLSILPFAADLESLTAELQRPPDQFSPITEGSSATKLNLANSGFTNFQYRYVWDAVSRITSNEKPTEESLFTQMVRGESNENQLNFIG